MSVQLLAPQPSPSQAILQSLTESIGETLPEGFKKGALSKGLKDISQESGLSPIELTGRLHSIMGMTPELATQIYPLIQSKLGEEAQRVFYGGGGRGGEGVPGEGMQTGGIPREDMQTGGIPGEGMPSEGTPSDRLVSERQRQQRIYGTGEDPGKVFRQAQEIQKRTNIPLDKAVDIAEKGIAKTAEHEKETLQAEQTYQQLLDTELGDLIKEREVDGGTYRPISDESLKNYHEQLKEVVRSGGHPKEAINDIVKDARSFAEDRGNLRISGRSIFSTMLDKKGRLNQLNQIRKNYEKIGMNRQFRDDLIAYQKLSPQIASEIAFPRSKPIKNILNKFKSPAIVTTKSTDKLYSDLLNNLSDKDSLLAIASDLHKKGILTGDFLNRVDSEYNKGDLSLNQTQLKELKSNRSPLRLSLSDLFYQTYNP